MKEKIIFNFFEDSVEESLEKIITYFVDAQAYIISTTDERCLLCVEKKEIQCGRFEHCDIREKMDYVGRKLYELGGTLEFFVSDTRADIEPYSMTPYERAYHQYEAILECSGYTYSDYLMHAIPEKVYQNLKIIDWFLTAIFFILDICVSELFPLRILLAEKNISILANICINKYKKFENIGKIWYTLP